jgi:hypothetical protein
MPTLSSVDLRAQVLALFARLNRLDSCGQALVSGYASNALDCLRVAVEVAEGMSAAPAAIEAPAPAGRAGLALATVDGEPVASPRCSKYRTTR